MHADLINLGWTEDHWNRICSTVAEEAQKARVAAQMLPVSGPVDPETVAVPNFRLYPQINPRLAPPPTPPDRLAVNSDPNLFLTRIAVNVPVRTREAADPGLSAALAMFRRAANYIARIEDALVFNGRAAGLPPLFGTAGIPNVFQVSGGGAAEGLFPMQAPWGNRIPINVAAVPAPHPAPALGDLLVTAIIQAINQLDGAGQLGPYACALSPLFFEAICTPNAALVLPRDRILPFLQGPLLRSSAIFENPTVRQAFGVVVALSGNPVELVVGSDIHVRFLQTTEEPRLIFRVSERVVLRIKEDAAIAVLFM